jgi:hypothetical protein
MPLIVDKKEQNKTEIKLNLLKSHTFHETSGIESDS